MENRENRDKELYEMYYKLESDCVPSGYGWPDFIECNTGGISAGDVLCSLQVALRSVVFCEKNYHQDPEELPCKTDKRFVVPFSILYSLYVDHFKRYLPNEPIPSVQDVSQAYIKEVVDCDVHEPSKELQ